MRDVTHGASSSPLKGEGIIAGRTSLGADACLGSGRVSRDTIAGAGMTVWRELGHEAEA